jgi:hypothetical protein
MENLGPLEQLIGTWKGNDGIDVFITPLGEKITTKYKETMTFEEIPQTPNPPSQTVYGLRYLTILENLATGEPMHQETGYWLINKNLLGGFTIIRTFSIPHGIAIMAGGNIDSTESHKWTVKARAGHASYGILNNHYLEIDAKTVEFSADYLIENNKLTYSEVSVLDFFFIDKRKHTDSNTLLRQV